MGKSNTGFTADADGGATGMFKAKDEPIGNKIMSAISDHYSSKFPTAGAVGGGLYNQVFGAGQAPIQTGTGPSIPGQDDQSDIIQQGMHPPGHSPFAKALFSAITGGM